MNIIYNWTDPSAKTLPMRELAAGSLVVLYVNPPGKNEEYHITQATGDIEHEEIYLASFHKADMALVVAKFLNNYFTKSVAPKDNDMSDGMKDLLSRAREHSGPIEFNPIQSDEPEADYEASEASLETYIQENNERINKKHKKGL